MSALAWVAVAASEVAAVVVVAVVAAVAAAWVLVRMRVLVRVTE